MAAPPLGPKVSIVVPTHERPALLARLLASLRDQTLSSEHYEVIVVDDGSGPETADSVTRAQQESGMMLRMHRLDPSQGPVPARNVGWRAARAPLVAFADDDEVAAPDWLEQGLRCAEANPDAIIQGRIEPEPGEADNARPWYHVVYSRGCGPWYGTGNIFYPRATLERLGGFDESTFAALGGGDTDLAWRAIEAGAPAVYAPDALVHHIVVRLGPIGALRRSARWTQIPALVKRHPGLRQHLLFRVFWTRRHCQFACAVLGMALGRRAWPISVWLVAPYVRFLVDRRSGPLLAPYLVARDAIEIGAVVRGSLRARTLVL